MRTGPTFIRRHLNVLFATSAILAVMVLEGSCDSGPTKPKCTCGGSQVCTPCDSLKAYSTANFGIESIVPADEKTEKEFAVANVSTWISLDVKFMANTDEETRDRSLRAIENMLMNSAKPLLKQYPHYQPIISIVKNPLGDPMHYLISVVNTYTSSS